MLCKKDVSLVYDKRGVFTPLISEAKFTGKKNLNNPT